MAASGDGGGLVLLAGIQRSCAEFDGVSVDFLWRVDWCADGRRGRWRCCGRFAAAITAFGKLEIGRQVGAVYFHVALAGSNQIGSQRMHN